MGGDAGDGVEAASGECVGERVGEHVRFAAGWNVALGELGERERRGGTAGSECAVMRRWRNGSSLRGCGTCIGRANRAVWECVRVAERVSVVVVNVDACVASRRQVAAEGGRRLGARSLCGWARGGWHRACM